jgi:6-phosphogluconolactonase
MARSPEIRIANTAADLFQAAAGEFAKMAEECIRARGRFSVALSGGSTPRDLFSLLASGDVSSLPSNSSAGNALPWEKIFFFWSDERHVPPDHPDSNYGMAYEAMLSKVPVPQEHIFRIHGEEKDADAAARAYEQTLRTAFATQPGEVPRFDLILLGIGTEGHTASLFPGSPALNETSRLFLVSGAGKAGILKQILEAPGDLPAQRVHPVDGRLLWMADRDAAAMLPH